MKIRKPSQGKVVGLQPVDEGWIVGGFERAYEAWISEDTTSESTSVTIKARAPASWTATKSFFGCFAPPTPSCIFSTPSPNVIGVCQKGQVFAFNVLDEGRVDLEVMPVRCIAVDVAGGRMFFATDVYVCAFDGVKTLWTSRPISLEGISDLAYKDGYISGFATDLGRKLVGFKIDAQNGTAVGGFTGFHSV
jgi:hypothetical protein